MTYTARDYTRSISTDEYTRRFRDAERFMQACRECPNYARSWACPPFDHDRDTELRQYENVLLIATKIVPDSSEIPVSEASRLIRPERVRLESKLREMEKTYGGRSFAFAGKCLYCPEGTCSRLQGEPCRHPELMRPSLEAYGFDIGRTLSELFGIDLLWGRDGHLPAYLTLVCAFFHNSAVTSGDEF